MRHILLVVPLALLTPAPAGAQEVDPTAASAARSGSAAWQADRWIVQFRQRSFDLSDLQHAVRAARPAHDVRAILDDLERRVCADQEPFTAAAAALGFRVVRRWWIVNACAVEGPASALARLHSLPNVLRVERDEAVPAAMGRATDEFNHNADKLHALGIKGNLQTVVAVMDSGADENMNGTARPHRLYYVDGDPTNLTGGGIGGSRLVKNQQLGALPADDVHGHGTYVASVCAGAAWGIPAADQGHACGAQIASYAIGEFIAQGVPFSSFSTMATAWQQIGADRAAGLNIVAANNSFNGPSDPLHFLQQTLDAVASTFDIVVCVSGGNEGPGPYTGKQSCVNGIAVGAVYPDTHEVAAWSSRGPVVGDPTRTYPDLVACTYSATAVPDCEATYTRFRGTSNAAPQVCGAAALLRAQVPSLRADATKAILLAATLDVSAQNPGLDRNAFGMGLLRDDVAMAVATDPAAHGRGAVQTAAPVWTFSFPVVQGAPYAVAIAWHRQNTASTAWSNLDLRILDGATVVAGSSTPRNLYERASFRAARTGTYVAEVRGTSIEGSQQDFGIAVARELDPAPLAGTYTSLGTACAGSGTGAGPVCLSANPGAQPLDLLNTIANPVGGQEWELAFEFTAPAAPIAVTGFESFTKMEAAESRRAMLFLADALGRPQSAPAQTGTQWVGIVPAWHRTEFAPQVIPAASRFFVGVQGLSPTSTWLALRSGTTALTYYSRRPCDAAWRGPFTMYAGFRINCGTAGPGAEPMLWSQGAPTLGATFQTNLRAALANTTALLLTGVSKSDWNGLRLPFDLAVLGATGCSLLASGDVVLPAAVDGLGGASIPFTIPSAGELLGARFYQQFVVLDPAANRLGLAFTNGGEGRIGGR